MLYKKRNVKRGDITPFVTLIISAYNEEKRIRQKLENTLQLDYPSQLLQVIVASDGSTDNTNAIVNEYADRNVELLKFDEHKGKESAQAEAVRNAHGKILVFTDVATELDSNGLRQIVSNFVDPSVGCVSSVDKILSDEGNEVGGEGFYVKYEMWLRAMESSIKSVVGLSGSFFAARAEVCQNFSTKMQSDFKTLLNSMQKGMRGISDPNSVGYYHDIKNKSKEFNRKVRTVLRGLTVFFNHLEFLNFIKYGIFSYMFFCHKLLRWAVPLFLVAAVVTSMMISHISIIYKIIFFMQLSFYSVAISGVLIPNLNKLVVIRIPSFFVIVNTSIFVAWLKYLKGERITLWQSSIRMFL